ncbi:DUF3352 domain-containing protein [Rubripirellula reticaptiva]|uniref:DUF3352 domain-containing protein n=1 Tax=Rubripirellula reticaptiva TaxID=2528013 RepID=A0A5C6EXD9_9BACT|nr:DUF3352 domain-containing protein [Rubripirellula reticaptiva]TWU51881.1 hypothetical protein Poly59_34770 [Rubripirellula reticaptiva]
MPHRFRRSQFGLAALFAISLAIVAPVHAQDASSRKTDAPESTVPGAPRMLPHDTLAYIRLDNVDQMRDDFSGSAVGKMLADPSLRPLAGDIYQTLAELFERVGQRVGLTLDELLAIPSGQVAIAALPGNLSDAEEAKVQDDADDESPDAIRRRIARKARQQNSFAGMFIVDAGKQVDDLMAAIEKLESGATQSGYVRRVSKVDGTDLIRLMPPREGRPEIEYFFREKTLVLGIGHGTASTALDHWIGKSDEATLAERTDFTSVMSRSIGAESTRPQLTFFVDPYHIVERLIKRGGAAAFVWPIVEELGIAKIRGLGGSSFRGGEVFEEISHLHILIDTPRDGFFGVLRPETVETTPPDWVPSDVTSYTSVQWDFPTTYKNLGKVLEKFQGPDPLGRFVAEPLKTRLGLELEEDVLDQVTGRYVSCRWVQPPIKLNSQVQLHGLEVKDPVKAKSVIAKIRDRMPGRIEVATVGGNVIYLIKTGRGGNMPQGLRKPEPCFTVLGNWLLISDSREFLERASMASSGSLNQLVSVPEFELVASELGGKLDGEKPFMVSFLRSSEYIRQLYGLAQSPDTRKFLKKQGEKNPLATKVVGMLERNELPPFEKFEKFFAPSGTFAYDEASGMHLGSFTLKAEE